MIQHILIIMPSDYNASQAFFDIALSFSQSLKSLGHPAEVTIDASIVFGKTLVFGAHLLPKFGGTIEGGDYIIFNTEQHDSHWMGPEYLDILKRYEVWDYSYNNIASLSQHGITAKFCEIGYSPCMSNIRLGKAATITGYSRVDYINNPSVTAAVGMFDVLFYGSINERRQKIIDDLRAEGINTVVINGYGAYRDKYISRAKIVLNMHYFDSAIFEVVRVSHLLANQRFIVSETGKEEGLETPYKEGIAFAAYDDLVKTCVEYLKDEKRRDDTAREGFNAIRSHSQSDILKKLL